MGGISYGSAAAVAFFCCVCVGRFAAAKPSLVLPCRVSVVCKLEWNIHDRSFRVDPHLYS